MGRSRTFKTGFAMHVWDGGEYEFQAVISYRVYPGSPQTRDDPGCDATAEIETVRLVKLDGTKEYPVPAWLQAMLEGDEALLDSLLSDAADADEYARDQAADATREEQRLRL